MAKMALLLSPLSKAKAFQFASLHSPNSKYNSPKIKQKQKNSVHFGSNTCFTHNGLKNDFFSKSKDANAKRVMPIVSASSIPLSSEDGKDTKFGRILLSDVMVKRKTNVYWGRRWDYLEVATFGVIIALHLLCLFAPFTFSWGAFWVAFGLYVITGLGITLSFHRNLSHRSFKLPKWLEYFFAYCGVQALQVYESCSN